MGFLPPAGEAVTWLTLHQPRRTFQVKWTVLEVSPSPEEDNTNYCKVLTHRVKKKTKKHCSGSLSPSSLFPFSAGLDFGAILAKPCSSSSEARLPLVVFIHGLRTLAVCLLTHEGACALISSVRLLSQVVLTLSSQQNGTVPQLDWFNWALLCSWVSPVM